MYCEKRCINKFELNWSEIMSWKYELSGRPQWLYYWESVMSTWIWIQMLKLLKEWLLSWCKEQKLLFANNWNLFWERPRLFRADGLHPSRVGAELLSDNISRTLRSIWLVSQFSNNCYDDFCSTHLNDRSNCVVQSIHTVSVPRIARSKYKFNAGSRKNLIVIKPEKMQNKWTKTIFKAWAPKH